MLTKAELGQEGHLSSISIIAFLDTSQDSMAHTHTHTNNAIFLPLETWLFKQPFHNTLKENN